VDLLLIVDTSGSVADAFLKERQFAIDLIEVVKPGDFAGRINVAAVSFHKVAKLEFEFNSVRDQESVLSKLKEIEFTGGATSLVAGFTKGLEEIARGRRPDARLVIVLVSGTNLICFVRLGSCCLEYLGRFFLMFPKDERYIPGMAGGGQGLIDNCMFRTCLSS
jgi:hypothetical protein